MPEAGEPAARRMFSFSFSIAPCNSILAYIPYILHAASAQSLAPDGFPLLAVGGRAAPLILGNFEVVSEALCPLAHLFAEVQPNSLHVAWFRSEAEHFYAFPNRTRVQLDLFA